MRQAASPDKTRGRTSLAELYGYGGSRLTSPGGVVDAADKGTAMRWQAFYPRVTLAVLLAMPLSEAGQGSVDLITVQGAIDPIVTRFATRAIASATDDHAEAVIIQMDTPGGLDVSMRQIVQAMIGSPVPVIVYVAPPGARAGSAGVFITMAAHVAAMAPGTNIGAAHPVAMGGGELDKTMKEKVENDSVAYIKSIAEQRGRNVAWA